MTKRSFAALLALALAGPAFQAVAIDPVRFPHATHSYFFSLVGDRRCLICHELPSKGPPTVRLKEGCGNCHGDDVPTYLEPAPLPQRAASGRLVVSFSHERHAASPRIGCSGCHRPTPEGEARGLTADRDCDACHARLGADRRDCNGCHAIDAKAWVPPDHGGAWTRSLHSLDGPLSSGQHGRDCRTCHGADACRRCHREREPQDHTALFKLRLHGTDAEWERERCAACHESGTCVRCHSTTPPQNHGAAWRSVHMLAAGAVGNASCGVCHRRSFCDACHLASP